jgi:TPP-dependent 2-oxoacid decarboxylase
MAEIAIPYVLRRLNEIGVDHIFGVAGDCAFPVNDPIIEHRRSLDRMSQRPQRRLRR